MLYEKAFVMKKEDESLIDVESLSLASLYLNSVLLPLCAYYCMVHTRLCFHYFILFALSVSTSLRLLRAD